MTLSSMAKNGCQDLKWHGYGPSPEVKTLKDFLDIVDLDAYGCFFG